MPDVDQIQVGQDRARAAMPIPIGTDTKLQRMDVVTVVGLKDAVSRSARQFGRVVRPSTATDLLTLSVGMMLGLLIGAIQFPASVHRVGLGNAGGLLVSGVIVSSVVVAAALLRQHAERRAQHPRGPRPRGLRRHRRHQRRQLAADAAHRRDRAEDLPGRLHRLLRSRPSSSGPSATTCSR